MLVDYLVRGAKAGVVAGLVFGLFVAVVANPLVGVAEELGSEHAADHDGHDAGSETVVSVAVTNAVSVGGGVLWGLLLGVVAFGGAFYLFEPAIPGGEATSSYVLAAAGFLTVSGAPWLVFPPQAPGVEAALSTSTRISLYGGLMVAGAIASVLAVVAYRRGYDAAGRYGGVAVGALPLLALASVAFVGVGGTVHAKSVAATALPDGFAAAYTGTVVFGQVLLWTVLAASNAHLASNSNETERNGSRNSESTARGATAD